MTEEKEAKTQPEPEKKSKKTKKPDEICTWTFHNYDDHFSSSCGCRFTCPPGPSAKAVVGNCPGCSKQIYCV